MTQSYIFKTGDTQRDAFVRIWLGVMCIVAKLYGLDSIFTFAFPLMMGMISGVYTSLCVSTSAWVLWSERSKKKN